jgi:hypothetical protein
MEAYVLTQVEAKFDALAETLDDLSIESISNSGAYLPWKSKTPFLARLTVEKSCPPLAGATAFNQDHNVGCKLEACNHLQGRVQMQ